MAHGGYGKRREATGRGTNGLARQQSDKQKKIKKTRKMASIKNQMRSIQRLLNKNLSPEMKSAQNKHLEDLKQQAEQNQRAELERKMSLRYRRVKFFERRKIERAIKQIEKLQEVGPDISKTGAMAQKQDATKRLTQLKEDLEYVRFFPKMEKYVSLFMGNDDEEVIAKRSKMREKIKANLAAAAATGVELEEPENNGDQGMDVNDDDFFLPGNASDEAEADDRWNVMTLKPGADHTAKTLPRSSARCTSAHKNHQQHQRPQNSSPSPQFRNQKTQSTGGVVKKKKQKVTMNPPLLGNRVPSYSRSQTASNKNVFASSALSSSNNRGSSNVHFSFIKSDINKVLPIPESDGSNMDAKKKRRRKHRPKRKTT